MRKLLLTLVAAACSIPAFAQMGAGPAGGNFENGMEAVQFDPGLYGHDEHRDFQSEWTDERQSEDVF